MTAPDRMPEAFENSLHDAGHPHMEPPANPGRFRVPGPSHWGHLEQCSILTPDWAQVRVILFSIVFPASFSAHCFGWTADDSTVFMPRRAVPASQSRELCAPL